MPPKTPAKKNPGLSTEELESHLNVKPPSDPAAIDDHVHQLLMRAQVSWLSKRDVLDILTNWQLYNLPISLMPPDQPAGSLFLFDRNQLKSFRRDNHVWKSKAGGKTVQETHEKLKIEGGIPALNCYYAHSADGTLQRRCYWKLAGNPNIVLMHYRSPINRKDNDAQGATPLHLQPRVPAGQYASGGPPVQSVPGSTESKQLVHANDCVGRPPCEAGEAADVPSPHEGIPPVNEAHPAHAQGNVHMLPSGMAPALPSFQIPAHSWQQQRPVTGYPGHLPSHDQAAMAMLAQQQHIYGLPAAVQQSKVAGGAHQHSLPHQYQDIPAPNVVHPHGDAGVIPPPPDEDEKAHDDAVEISGSGPTSHDHAESAIEDLPSDVPTYKQELPLAVKEIETDADRHDGNLDAFGKRTRSGDANVDDFACQERLGDIDGSAHLAKRSRVDRTCLGASPASHLDEHV